MAAENPKSVLLQGTLDMLILKVVALGPTHGYAIAQRLQQMSQDVLQVQQGSLYPALHRLEKRGWVKAEWAASDTGRSGHCHSISGSVNGNDSTSTQQITACAGICADNCAPTT